MKLKLLRRRLSIAAPTMMIRQRLPWPVRLLANILLVVIGFSIVFWVYDMGSSFTGANGKNLKDQIVTLSEQVRELHKERDALATKVNEAESQLNIARATSDQLVDQLRTVEGDNVRLKEDLAFFESLLPTNIGAQGITIQRLKVDMVAPNQLRYRLLVLQGGRGRQQQMFDGNLQISATVSQNGRSSVMHFPEGILAAPEGNKYKLSFKYYQRVEGILTVPEGSTVKAVQAKVLANGQVRAQESANM